MSHPDEVPTETLLKHQECDPDERPFALPGPAVQVDLSDIRDPHWRCHGVPAKLRTPRSELTQIKQRCLEGAAPPYPARILPFVIVRPSFRMDEFHAAAFQEVHRHRSRVQKGIAL